MALNGTTEEYWKRRRMIEISLIQLVITSPKTDLAKATSERVIAHTGCVETVEQQGMKCKTLADHPRLRRTKSNHQGKAGLGTSLLGLAANSRGATSGQ